MFISSRYSIIFARICSSNLFYYREFIEGKVHYRPREIDFSDFIDKKDHRYKDYLIDEMECVEETLMKRRAELREADRLLMECEQDLKDARAEVSPLDILKI